MPGILMFLSVAIPVSIRDIREKRVPNEILGAGFVFASWCASRYDGQRFLGVLLGAALGFLLFWCVWCLSQGKIGLGDVKYASLVGAFAGVAGLCAAVFVASATGLVVALVLIAMDRRNIRARIPFAPFLSLGGVAALVMQAARWPDFLAGGI